MAIDEEQAGARLTCCIRYSLDMGKLSEFIAYAKIWARLINKYGGEHHGYFLPRAAPNFAAISFPGVGTDAAPNEAISLFSFADEESYRRYRAEVRLDPECLAAEAIARESACFLSYERSFLTALA